MVRNRKPVIVLDTGLQRFKDLLVTEGFRVYLGDEAGRMGFDFSNLKENHDFLSGWIFMTHRFGLYEAQQVDADFNLILVSMDSDTVTVAISIGHWATAYQPQGKRILWRMEFSATGQMVSFQELAKRADDDSDSNHAIWNQLSPETRNVLTMLSPTEEQRLRERFGKEWDNPAVTLEDVGRDFFVSRDRIREIECKALRKLKTMKEKENQTDGTIRQKLIDLLKVRPWDAGGLSRALGISQRQVEGHLNHVSKSVEVQGLRWVIDPSRCGECDFRFVGRDRTTKPSRCPKCRSEQIVPPMFSVEGQSEGGG